MTERSPVAIRSQPLVYDEIGGLYTRYRVPDPRIAARIRAALGDARTVCHVGAGAGAYEPGDRTVVAIEPSLTMCRQRESGAIRAVSEALPFGDRSFDAATAILTAHHWQDVDAGLSELCRVAPRRVLLVFDLARQMDMWLVKDYLPEIAVLDRRAPAVDDVCRRVGATRCEPVPVHWDCSDGFLCAYWRRPHMYLDADVRACISGIAQLDERIVSRAMDSLRDDLATGAWHAHNQDLLARDAMDYGYRLVIAD